MNLAYNLTYIDLAANKNIYLSKHGTNDNQEGENNTQIDEESKSKDWHFNIEIYKEGEKINDFTLTNNARDERVYYQQGKG